MSVKESYTLSREVHGYYIGLTPEGRIMAFEMNEGRILIDTYTPKEFYKMLKKVHQPVKVMDAYRTLDMVIRG